MGGQEVLFPALIPREIFEASGRYADYGDALFRLHDRKGIDYLLAPDARGTVHRCWSRASLLLPRLSH